MGYPVKHAPAKTDSITRVSGSASNVTLIAANASRRRETIVNDSSATLYVKFGETASITDYSYKLEVNQTLEFPAPVYTGIVDGIWSSATGAAQCTEAV